MLGAIGVVYGDIGTSPLYALKECFSPESPHHVAVSTTNVLGVLSLERPQAAQTSIGVFIGCDAEPFAGAGMVRRVGGGDERFRRDAAPVEAIAAHFARFEQYDLQAELRRAGGDGEPRGARADDADVGLVILHGAGSVFGLRSALARIGKSDKTINPTIGKMISGANNSARPCAAGSAETPASNAARNPLPTEA